MLSSILLCVCFVIQLCPTLCDPMSCSPPGSSVHEIFQPRILEWVAISYSRGSSWHRDWTPISAPLVLAGRFLTTEPPGKLTLTPLQWINFPCSLVRPNLSLLPFHAYLQSSLLPAAFFSSSSSSFPSLPDHTHQYTNMLRYHTLQEASKKLMALN